LPYIDEHAASEARVKRMASVLVMVNGGSRLDSGSVEATECCPRITTEPKGLRRRRRKQCKAGAWLRR
jgi:hypothetical protein